MKKTNYIIEFIVIGIVGTLWHFIYKWTGGNAFIGAISPVNESTWEHLKLLFFPSLIYTVAEWFCIKARQGGYLAASAAGIYAGMGSIVVFFYTYTGILGFDVMFLDVISFFLGIFVMLYVKRLIIKGEKMLSKSCGVTAAAVLLITAALFVIWTFMPPELGIFELPV